MDSRIGALPDDIEALKAALVVEAARAAHVGAELAVARAKAANDQALIAHQQLRIEKLTRQLYGPRSERRSRILDQIELQFEELESSAHRGRDRRRDGGGQDHDGGSVYPQAPRPQAVPGTPTARAGDRTGTDNVPLLRWGPAAQ